MSFALLLLFISLRILMYESKNAQMWVTQLKHIIVSLWKKLMSSLVWGLGQVFSHFMLRFSLGETGFQYQKDCIPAFLCKSFPCILTPDFTLCNFYSHGCSPFTWSAWTKCRELEKSQTKEKYTFFPHLPVFLIFYIALIWNYHQEKQE